MAHGSIVRCAKDPADRRRVVVEPIPERIEREIAPLFESIGRTMGDVCSQYSNQELAVIREFIARFHQGASDEIQKLREGDGQLFEEPPKSPALSKEEKGTRRRSTWQRR